MLGSSAVVGGGGVGGLGAFDNGSKDPMPD